MHDSIYSLYIVTPVPLRFAYFMWFSFIVLYYHSYLYDKYRGKKDGVPIENNFNAVFLVSGLAFVFLNQVLIWNGVSGNKIIEDVLIETINAKAATAYIKFFIESEVVQWVGFACMVIGIVITAHARAALNGYWSRSIIQYNSPDDKLVTYGIYSVMRHPIYVAQLLLAVGTAFLSTSLFVIMFPAILGWANYKRARKEEIYLRKLYPDSGTSEETSYKIYSLKVSACGLRLL